MKEIIIKQLSLLNFKGVRDLTIDFDARVTDISGRNGLGKTTIFDAFTWLLCKYPIHYILIVYVLWGGNKNSRNIL